MKVHLIDGTYELFRHYFALPSRRDADGREVGALVGVLRSVLSMIRDGATHLGVATDHTVESFRNNIYGGYKTGDGIEPELFDQFHPLEDALRALGVTVWPMIDHEADDGLAAAAARAHASKGVDQVVICTADKDLAQCVRDDAIVQLDRRRNVIRNEHAVIEKFGVPPTSIPDYLALVGDAADGFPGVPRWGARSAARVLSRFRKLEAIPRDAATWGASVRGAAGLAASLRENWEDALLFRELATLRTDAEVFGEIDELRWKGPAENFPRVCEHLGVPGLASSAEQLHPRD